MKKILSICMAFIMIASSFAMTAFASDTIITFTNVPTAITVGEQIMIDVEISGNSGFASVGLYLKYDTNVLKFKGLKETQYDLGGVSITLTDGLFGSGTVVVNKDSAFITLAKTENITGDGKLFTAIFETVAPGNTNINVEIDNFKNANQEQIDVETVPSSLKVTKTYTVNLDSCFSGSGSVDFGEDYKFTLNKEEGYDYEISATMGGQPVDVVDNGDNSYTIKAVSGNLDISAVRSLKKYGVTVTGSGKGDVTYNVKADHGVSYSFTVNKDANYNYSVSVTVGGKSITPAESGETYTINGSDVTGDVAITVTKEPKTYKVSYTENADVTAGDTATYGTDFSFSIAKNSGYFYTVGVEIGGKEYAGFSVTGNSYTIPGSDITGDIVINVAKEKKANYSVTLADSNAKDDVTKYESQVLQGDSYTFTVSKKPLYTYNVSATMGDKSAVLKDNQDGTYTIENVQGNIVITVARTGQSFSIAFEGNAAGDVEGKSASGLVHGTDYSFTVSKDEHYDYSVAIKKTDGTAPSYTEQGGKYTISGAAINSDITVTVVKNPKQYDVTVSGGGAGDVTFAAKATYNSQYSFKLSADSNYNYVVSATVGGEAVSTQENSGTYTIPAAAVTGNIAINVSKTPKTYTVTATENADVEAAKTATYGTDFVFKVNKAEHYNYTVKVTVGGKDYTPSVNGDEYTIKGADITGNININATKSPETYKVTASGTASDNVYKTDTATYGQDYTFTVAKSEYFNYEVKVKVGGAEVTPTVDGNSYTVSKGDVTGNIEIIANKSGVQFSVTVDGEDMVKSAEKATHGTDYTLTLNRDENYAYIVTMTVGGTAYTGFGVSGNTYTIPGSDIKGEIVVNVEKKELEDFAVTVEGNAAGEVTYGAEAKESKDYSFTVAKKSGYSYKVTAKVGENSVPVKAEANGRYTISGNYISGNITITVTSEPIPVKDETTTIVIGGEHAGEENPNTGAPAALPVLVLIGAAAAVLKRKK
ncbi:MAG: hypothetical protein ACI4IW_08615 [Oscillospiraceae bacterium]